MYTGYIPNADIIEDDARPESTAHEDSGVVSDDSRDGNQFDEEEGTLVS